MHYAWHWNCICYVSNLIVEIKGLLLAWWLLWQQLQVALYLFVNTLPFLFQIGIIWAVPWKLVDFLYGKIKKPTYLLLCSFVMPVLKTTTTVSLGAKTIKKDINSTQNKSLKLTVLNNTKFRHFWAQIVSWAPRHARKMFIVLAPGHGEFFWNVLYASIWLSIVGMCAGANVSWAFNFFMNGVYHAVRACLPITL